MRCILKRSLKFCTSYCIETTKLLTATWLQDDNSNVLQMRLLVLKAILLIFAKCHNKNNKNNNF